MKTKVKITQSCPTLCDPMDYTVHEILQTRILEWVTVPFSGNLPNPGLSHCRQIIYQLIHQGSPRILEWVVSLFSSGSPWPRHRTRVSCIAGRFFTSWATREQLNSILLNFTSIRTLECSLTWKDVTVMMKSQWIRVCPKSNMTGVLTRGRYGQKDTEGGQSCEEGERLKPSQGH